MQEENEMSLQAIFEDEREAKTEPEKPIEEPKKPKQEAQQEQLSQDDGEKVDNQEETTTEPENQEEPTEKDSWTKKAVLDERRKRQDLEKKMQELEAKLSLGNKQETSREDIIPDKIPDVVEDPEGYQNYLQKQFENQSFNYRAALTADLMKEKYEDYEEMEKRFLDMAAKNEALKSQIFTAPNPAKFAYETAKNSLEAEKIKDPNYIKSLREELKKEVLAELAQSQGSKASKPNVKAMPDFSQAASAKSGDKFIEDKSLEEIFGN